MDAAVLVGDRRLGGAPRDVVHEHRPRRRDRLQPGGRVDGVPVDHALLHPGCVDRRRAREHARAQGQPRHRHLLTQGAHGLRQGERRSHRTLGIVLVGHRSAPHGHDRVADELFERAAVAIDDRTAVREVQRQQGSHVLGVAALRQGGEADEVGEQHAHQLTFRGRAHWRARGLSRRAGRRRLGQGAAAGRTEAIALAGSGAARRARLSLRRPAPPAEGLSELHRGRALPACAHRCPPHPTAARRAGLLAGARTAARGPRPFALASMAKGYSQSWPVPGVREARPGSAGGGLERNRRSAGMARRGDGRES